MRLGIIRLIFPMLLIFLVGSFLLADPIEGRRSPLSKTEIELAKKAKLTFAQAKKIALEKAPGTIFNWELEKENGKIIYSIQIQLPDDKEYSREVNVDAMTGKVLSVEKENLKEQLSSAQTTS